MAGTGSSATHIKDEPEDFQFDPQRFTPHPNGYNMSQPANKPFGSSSYTAAGSVDPSQLTMNSSSLQRTFGSQQNLSSSFITDDDLFSIGNENDSSGQQGPSNANFNRFPDQNNFNNGPMFDTSPFPDNSASNPIQVNQYSSMNQIYSNTPDGAPIQSPYIKSSSYAQYQSMPSTQQQPGLQQGSSLNGLNGRSGSLDMRRGMKHLEKTGSSSRSQMTPRIGGLQLGSPEPGSLHSQPIQTNQMNQMNMHRRQMSQGTWDGTPGSSHSYVESPLSSPHAALGHPQHASLPTKVDGAPTAEAKKKRRRESHNLVERRRRDNINERIQELSHLVPAHRLDDEKIRKHLANSTPLSPTISATGMSPPQATSLLAGGAGRRATGSITQGLPIEEKDKGPNKGDILNGAVSWTRDLMWMLHRKLQHEAELIDTITSLGGLPPYEISEEEQRMRTELMEAIERNDAGNFEYSRAQGSGLCVPKHTNMAGDALSNQRAGQDPMAMNQQHNGGNGLETQQFSQFNWQHDLNVDEPEAFKEEDEYEMELS